VTLTARLSYARGGCRVGVNHIIPATFFYGPPGDESDHLGRPLHPRRDGLVIVNTGRRSPGFEAQVLLHALST